MSERHWISVTSKLFAYCSHLILEIKKLQDKCKKLQEESARLKSLVEKQEKLLIQHGSYDTVH